MTTQPEDGAPPRALAVPDDAAERAAFLAELQEAVHDVVLTDIHKIDALHEAADRDKAKLFAKVDLIVLPCAGIVIVILQIMNRALFAEAAALIPNVGLFILRVVKKIPG